MKLSVIMAVLLAATSAVHAVPPQNPDQVTAMVAELESLHQQGVRIHSDYDPEDQAQRNACQAEHADLEAEATELRDRAAQLPELAYRVHLTMAANQAVECVSCASPGNKCDSIPVALERVDQQMKAGSDSDTATD